MRKIFLLQYLDPNFSLLKLFQEKALGSYLHSINVGQMSAYAGNKIKGVDSLIVMLGGIYHDIGKIFKAEFYIENADDKKIILSSKNKRIILEHPRRGLEIAKKYGLPKEIFRFILSHHGDAEFFESKKSDCQGFKYFGPKPRRKDEALVMLADSCEAAVRKNRKKMVNKAEMQKIVQAVFRNKKEQNQLSLVEFSRDEENLIKEKLAEYLVNFYHLR